MAGIYIHVPFCSHFCNYCDFYSTKQLSKREGFSRALINEIISRSTHFKQLKLEIETIYFGGGTPSLLSAEQLSRALEALTTHYPLSNDRVKPLEISIELNPDDITLEYARSLKDIGFNRVSLGLQSFNDAHLKWMNRRHSAQRGVEALLLLKEAGFTNISLDLIFGFEQLSMAEWIRNIERAIELSPTHLSCYQLGIEPGTALYKEYISGAYKAPSDQLSLEQYTVLQESLQNAGYAQYEVSSFCKEGFESRHNSSYWDFIPYFGFGPGAHSFDGSCRFWNKKGIDGYNERWSNSFAVEEFRGIGYERLTPIDFFNELIMLSLRRVRGLEIDRANQLLLDKILAAKSLSFYKALNKSLERGELIEKEGHIYIPSNLLFVSDNIIRNLFI